MQHPFKVFDTVEDYVAGIGAQLANFERHDVVPVYVDVMDPTEGPQGAPQRGGKVTVFPINGQAVVDQLGFIAPMLPPEVLHEVYRTEFATHESDHPIDVAFRQLRIRPTATAIVNAGLIEWHSDLRLTERMHAHLPSGTIDLVACTCSKDLKIETLAAHRMAPYVRSLIFTEACDGGAALCAIVQAFLSSQHGN